MEGVADGRCWQWLRAGYLAKSIEAFIFAAQEQALRTRLLRRTIVRMPNDVVAECRVCGKVGESVAHLASGCSVLAQKAYKRRHNRMVFRVDWELCRQYGVKSSERLFEEMAMFGVFLIGSSRAFFWCNGKYSIKETKCN